MQRVMNITSVYPHLEMVRAFHLYEGQLHLVRQKNRAVLQQWRISNVCRREHVGAEQPKCWTVTNLSLRSKTTLCPPLCCAGSYAFFLGKETPISRSRIKIFSRKREKCPQVAKEEGALPVQLQQTRRSSSMTRAALSRLISFKAQVQSSCAGSESDQGFPEPVLLYF